MARYDDILRELNRLRQRVQAGGIVRPVPTKEQQVQSRYEQSPYYQRPSLARNVSYAVQQPFAAAQQAVQNNPYGQALTQTLTGLYRGTADFGKSLGTAAERQIYGKSRLATEQEAADTLARLGRHRQAESLYRNIADQQRNYASFTPQRVASGALSTLGLTLAASQPLVHPARYAGFAGFSAGLGGLLGGGSAALQGGNIKQGASLGATQALGRSPAMFGGLQATGAVLSPILQKTGLPIQRNLAKVLPGRLPQIAVNRAVPSVANVAEGLVLDRITGLETDASSIALDAVMGIIFGPGSVMQGTQKIPSVESVQKNIELKLRSKGVSATDAHKAASDYFNNRDIRGRFAKAEGEPFRSVKDLASMTQDRARKIRLNWFNPKTGQMEQSNLLDIVSDDSGFTRIPSLDRIAEGATRKIKSHRAFKDSIIFKLKQGAKLSDLSDQEKAFAIKFINLEDMNRAKVNTPDTQVRDLDKIQEILVRHKDVLRKKFTGSKIADIKNRVSLLIDKKVMRAAADIRKGEPLKDVARRYKLGGDVQTAQELASGRELLAYYGLVSKSQIAGKTKLLEDIAAEIANQPVGSAYFTHRPLFNTLLKQHRAKLRVQPDVTKARLGMDDSPEIKAAEQAIFGTPDPNAKPTTFMSTKQEVQKAQIQGEPEFRQKFDTLFAKWIGKRDAATTRATQTGSKFAAIPLKEAEDVIKAMEGAEGTTKSASNYVEPLHKEFDRLYRDAIDNGIDIGHRENYITHYWEQPPFKVAEEYKILKQREGFQNSRAFPTYEEGIAMGYKPKYAHPAQIITEYARRLEQLKVNLEFFDQLKKENIIVDAAQGSRTPGFVPIRGRGFPRVSSKADATTIIKGNYYAPASIAEQINRVFSPENVGSLSKFFNFSANASAQFQNAYLSGGVPTKPINAFSIAIGQKEILGGRVRPTVETFFKSSSHKQSLEFFEENAEQIIKMQERNIPIFSEYRIDSLLADAPEKTLSQKAKDLWGESTNYPTFRRFMPMLEVKFFNDIEAQALKVGKSPDEAADIAAQATKNWYGILDSATRAKRTKLVRDIATTGIFAPPYREAMINFWGKNAKALLNPLALENRANIKFIAGSALLLGAMDTLNRALNNGRSMLDNPDGKKDKLLVPIDDNTTVGIPWLSSIATIPRAVFREANLIRQGEFEAAGKDVAQTFLAAWLKPITDVFNNEDYFGNAIYKETDDDKEKWKKAFTYLGSQLTAHPWIREITNPASQGDPLYQRLSRASELPIRYYDRKSVENAPFWDRYHKLKPFNEEYNKIYEEDEKLAYLEKHKDKLAEFQVLQDQVKEYFDREEIGKLRLDPNEPQYEVSDDAPKNIGETLLTYGHSVITNPLETIDVMRRGEPIRKIRRPDNVTLFNILDGITVTERKLGVSDLDKGDKRTQVDHILPKWAGGREVASNYQLLTVEEHQRKTLANQRLLAQYEAGEIGKQDLLREIDAINKTLSPIAMPEEDKESLAAGNITFITDGKTETINIEELNKIPTSRTATIELDKKRFKLVSKVFDKEDMSDEEKENFFRSIGVDVKDAYYYNVARRDNNFKTAYVLDEIEKITATSKDRGDVLRFFVEMRRVVNGKKILANGVIDDLFNSGLITTAEKKKLKDLDFDSLGREKLKTTGRGKSAKIKSIKISESDLGGNLSAVLRSSSNELPSFARLKVRPPDLSKIRAANII